MPAFAESAPVYDADTLEQQFENSGNEGQNLPPPPPPDRDNTFVPMQQQSSQPVVQQEVERDSAQAAVSPPPPRSAAKTPSYLRPIAPTHDDTRDLSMGDRIGRIEQQLSNLQNRDSSTRIEALQNEVQSLRGQVEQLNRQLELSQKEQKSLYTDLDKRLSQKLAQTDNTPQPVKQSSVKAVKTAEKSIDANNPPTAQAADDPNVLEEQQIYQSAYNLIKSKKYDDAINTLQSMLKKYPSGQFASNAHYWLGELYGLLGKYDLALTEFSAVLKNYPDSPRVSDAQLKVGLIYASQLKWNDAKSAFKKVINHYPGTASSKLASEQLKQIKQSGH
ncbi:MAG: tol-pal system protein YbgF [Gammaproteobacteria bacterium RIFCSPHIGHO2_12_FULL_38_14]|nr:MAG: tol-pal system protein YbgF [Gammaproteobacteria bacterium RIFCSPHIGHO2_12_FULL_38_14]